MMSILAKSLSVLFDWTRRTIKRITAIGKSMISWLGLLELAGATVMVALAPALASAFAAYPIPHLGIKWVDVLVTPMLIGGMYLMALYFPFVMSVLVALGIHKANHNFVSRIRAKRKVKHAHVAGRPLQQVA